MFSFFLHISVCPLLNCMLSTGFAIRQVVVNYFDWNFSVQVKVLFQWRLKLTVMISLNILHIMISPVLVWSFAVFSAVICSL